VKYLPFVSLRLKLLSALFIAGLMTLQPIVYAHTGAQPDEKESKVDCRSVFNFTFPKILDFMAEIDCNQFITLVARLHEFFLITKRIRHLLLL
jgi:hypothetical protein